MGRVWSTGIFEERRQGLQRDIPEEQIFLLRGRHLRMRKKHAHTFADPFLFVEGDFCYLFLEVQEVDSKGYINVYRTKDLRSWSDLGPVLKEPFHLSYPFIGRHPQEGIFMLPESSEANCIRLYFFEDFPLKVKPARILLEGNFADSNLIEYEGYYYLSTYNQESARHELYVSDEMLKGYEKHPANRQSLTMHSGRNGGGFFKVGDRLFRAVQKATPSHGAEIVINEVFHLSPEAFHEETVVSDLRPKRDYDWQRLGRHHWSQVSFKGKRIVAIDGLQNDSILNRAINFLFKIFSGKSWKSGK